MMLILILAIGFYLYKTGELGRLLNKVQTLGSNSSSNLNEARRIIDLRFAKGEITAEEYSKLKNLL
ncbi:hypothetical protein [Tepidibacillus fermentans]|uniref:Uncharacterized protein n=1 Tax=Tepidibacillus fermentans TaxID=1281767 RepID=A0A4R3K501_9BACI|nr:hypothetical protein [Tepidibacillus fermentans]TCS77843.1 hypothetical protein EDD72_13311 [Tepidibacillus fermentans]